MQPSRRVSACGVDREALNLLESATRLYLGSKGWVFQPTPRNADVVFVDAGSMEGRQFLDAPSLANGGHIVRLVDETERSASGESVTKPLRYRSVLRVLTSLSGRTLAGSATRGSLLDVLEEQLAQGIPFVLDVAETPLFIDPRSSFFFSPSEWRPDADLFRTEPSQILVRTVSLGDPVCDRRWKLESLLFNAALYRGPRDADIFDDSRWKLLRWPDLGEANASPLLVRLCACLHARPATLTELEERSGLPREDAADFLFACQRTGLLAGEKAAGTGTATAMPEDDGRRAGIYAAIRARLFG